MKRLTIQLILAFSIIGFVSCQKDDAEPDTPTNNDDESKYTQYGTPFEDVPEKDDVIMYEVNLRAFSDDGDLQGVIDKLDHIQDLSVNVIWLMPIYPDGEVNSVNSPYCVRNYKAVGSEYGTLDDLRELTDEAHARGMAVILDWVANHTSWDNEWIENIYWYTRDDDGNIISPEGTNWTDVADLNYSNTYMMDTMVDAMMYWVYEANIDGFRCDYADGVPYGFWKRAWDTITSVPNRDFIFFAEGERDDHFDAGFDLNFGWGFYSSVLGVFEGDPVSDIFSAYTNEYNNLEEGKNWLHFTTNHDMSAWDGSPLSFFDGIDGALAASAVTIFTGGVPLIYGSQEVGTANTVPFFSNSTINWNSNPDMLEAYKKMFQFYSESNAARNGDNTYYPDNDIACFKKSYNNDDVVIIINMRNTAINYTVPTEINNKSWIDVMTQSNITLSGQLSLDPYEFYILK